METEETSQNKKRRKGDIRDAFKRQETARDVSQEHEPEAETEAEAEAETETEVLETGVYYGETVEVEKVNWEEVFEKHTQETLRLEREREERIERKEKQEKSWELLRECVKYLKENEKVWKRDEDNQLSERQRKEIKNKEKQAQARRKRNRK